MGFHFPEVKVVKLEQNYRSTNTILRAANTVIKNNLRRRGKQLWSDKGDGANFRSCTPSRTTKKKRARSWSKSITRGSRAAFPGATTRFSFAPTSNRARSKRPCAPPGSALSFDWAGKAFLTGAEIRDFLAYLQNILIPHDDISLLRIANTARARREGDVTMERLLGASHERKASAFAADEKSRGYSNT